MLAAYYRFVLRHRAAVLGLCLLVTALAAASLSRTVVASSIEKLFLGELPAYQRYQARMIELGSDEAIVIAYEDDAPLSAESLARLERAVDRVEARPEVQRVVSLLDAVHVSGADGALTVEPWRDLAAADPAAARDKLAADPQYGGALISADGHAATFVVQLTVDPLRSAETVPLLVDEVLGDLQAEGFARERLHRAGFPAVVAEVMRQSWLNLLVLFPLSSLALLGVVVAIFRRLTPALVAQGIGLLAVGWTLGFAALIDREFSIFTAIVPAVVLTVSFSDIVHLWSAYEEELRRGLAKDDAISAAASDVGVACLLTSATTFTGFVSLSATPTPASRMLGITLGFGVGIALLLAMTLVPIAWSWLPEPTPRPHRRGPIDRLVAACARLSTRRPRAVLAGWVLLMLPIGLGLSRFTIETDFPARLAADNSLQVDQRFFETHFAGNGTVELFVDTDVQDGVLDSETFAAVVALHDQLEARPDVDRVVGLPDIVRSVHRALAGNGPLPTAPGAIAQYVLLFELGGGEDLDAWLDFERKTLRLRLHTDEQGFRATGRLGAEAQALGQALLGDRARVEATGMAWLLGATFDDILAGQTGGLLLSFAVIGVMMAIGLRSVRAGLWSMLPNLLPLAVLLGVAGLLQARTDSDILIIALMAIGIGVDDTIHFLMRLRLERGRTGDDGEALQQTFDFAGRAIVMTTVILCIGFLPFALSDYWSVWAMGTALPMVLVVALAADLLLVPAMVRVGLMPR